MLEKFPFLKTTDHANNDQYCHTLVADALGAFIFEKLFHVELLTNCVIVTVCFGPLFVSVFTQCCDWHCLLCLLSCICIYVCICILNVFVSVLVYLCLTTDQWSAM